MSIQGTLKAIVKGKVLLTDYQGSLSPVLGYVVLYQGRKIVEIVSEQQYQQQYKTGQVQEIDAAGNYVSPGFINQHIHGCGGTDAMDGTPEALLNVAREQARYGVTSFLPTTMTSSPQAMAQALTAIEETMGLQEAESSQNWDGEAIMGARILGCHLEGPFISKAQKGAQKEKYILPANFELLAPWQHTIKLLTIAPEALAIDQPWDFVTSCRKAGILLSIGHTNADYQVTLDMINSYGVQHFTHLYNAMTGLHHRHPGAVGAALDTDVYCELICDNIHVAPAMQRLVYRLKGAHRLILITDSIRACGLGDGKSELGGQEVFVQNQKATLADGTIAGSVLTMNQGIANLAENLNLPIWAATTCATVTPAKGLNIYEKTGSLTQGKDADIVIFDDHMNIQQTICQGRTIYVNN